jgi:hypothetical protein
MFSIIFCCRYLSAQARVTKFLRHKFLQNVFLAVEVVNDKLFTYIDTIKR